MDTSTLGRGESTKPGQLHCESLDLLELLCLAPSSVDAFPQPIDRPGWLSGHFRTPRRLRAFSSTGLPGGPVPLAAALEPTGVAARLRGSPASVVVPSIFGPALDLLERLSELSDRALVAALDPFWRLGGGVVPYAIARPRSPVIDRCRSVEAAAIRRAHSRASTSRSASIRFVRRRSSINRCAASRRCASVTTSGGW